MKKSLVTKVTKFDKKDSFNNTSFSIEFANGDSGFYSTKDGDQKKFVVGSESEYEIEAKQSKKGTTYYKLTLPGEAQPLKSSGKPFVEPRVQMISFAMSYTKDLIVAGKVQLSGLSETFDIIYNEMTSKL